MAGYTKADFDRMYSLRAEREWGHPATRPEVRLHYHYGVSQKRIAARWDAIVAHLGLTAADIIVVAGGGFGWAVEHLEQALPGINAVSVDISDYVDNEKGNDEGAEIDAAITAVGLDPLAGRGLQIKNKYFRAGPRSRSVVLKDDMLSVPSRNRVRQALGNNMPTHIFTEDMVGEFPETEIAAWVVEIDKIPAETIHVMSSETARSGTDVNTITGHRVLVVSGGVVHQDIP